MNNNEQTEEYEVISLYFHFRRRRQQRLENKKAHKKDSLGIVNTLYQKLKYDGE